MTARRHLCAKNLFCPMCTPNAPFKPIAPQTSWPTRSPEVEYRSAYRVTDDGRVYANGRRIPQGDPFG